MDSIEKRLVTWPGESAEAILQQRFWHISNNIGHHGTVVALVVASVPQGTQMEFWPFTPFIFT